MVAPGVVVAMVTDCAPVYVPATGLNVGVATVDPNADAAVPRAAQTTTRKLKNVLRALDVTEFMSIPFPSRLTQSAFDPMHFTWSTSRI